MTGGECIRSGRASGTVADPTEHIGCSSSGGSRPRHVMLRKPTNAMDELSDDEWKVSSCRRQALSACRQHGERGLELLPVSHLARADLAEIVSITRYEDRTWRTDKRLTSGARDLALRAICESAEALLPLTRDVPDVHAHVDVMFLLCALPTRRARTAGSQTPRGLTSWAPRAFHWASTKRTTPRHWPRGRFVCACLSTCCGYWGGRTRTCDFLINSQNQQNPGSYLVIPMWCAPKGLTFSVDSLAYRRLTSCGFHLASTSRTPPTVTDANHARAHLAESIEREAHEANDRGARPLVRR